MMAERDGRLRVPYFGDYLLFGEIGRGATGVVYDAQQVSLDRPVALKILHAGLLAAEGAVQRLRFEAEMTARLAHPNIVPLYEIGEHEGQPYLAMGLVEGESLEEKLTGSNEAMRSGAAAGLVATLARAVHHAHQRGVLHRDLKPGNILIDQAGAPHVIDFGLAKCLETDGGLTRTGSFLGTAAYTSPEQAAGRANSATAVSDVYSLGAILYALLTRRPPYTGESVTDTLRQVAGPEPPRTPRSLRPDLSKDLNAICLKALEKEPSFRYGSALELATDLEAYVEGSPVRARRVSWFKQIWMWMRRRPVHAALWGTVGLAAILVGAYTDARLSAREKAADARQRSLLQEVQAIRLSEHVHGWRQEAVDRLAQAARLPIPASEPLLDEASAVLSGIDARQVRYFTNLAVSRVAFDVEGERLLMAQDGDVARLWDPSADQFHLSPSPSTDEIAFLPSGAAAYVAYDAATHSLLLRELASADVLQTWEIPTQPGPSSRPIGRPKIIRLGPGGTNVFAACQAGEDQEVLLLLDANSVHSLETSSTPITTLGLSPDGTVAVAGDSTGAIRAWAVAGAQRIANFRPTRNAVESLALLRPRRSADSEANPASDWTLAVGDAGGLVTVCDLRHQSVTSFCRGGHHNVFALAFSSDGMTLASAGRGPVKLWDFHTGRLLLDIDVSDDVQDLRFSPDGRRLAVGSGRTFVRDPHTSLWEIERPPAIDTLRGLAGEISKITFSADGRRVAALSHNWEVGIWDQEDDRLLRIIHVPPGEFADNAALAFSPDGRCLAFSAYRSARVWSVSDGRELDAWDLPPGLVDLLAYRNEQQLLLFRAETRDGIVPPYGNDPALHPRVCRIRNLRLKDGVENPLTSILDFNLRVADACLPPDGHCVVVEGIKGDRDDRARRIACFDTMAGSRLWDIELQDVSRPAEPFCDTAGKALVFALAGTPYAEVADLRSGLIMRRLESRPSAAAQDLNLRIERTSLTGGWFGLALHRDAAKHPRVRFALDKTAPNVTAFDAPGCRLAWGNRDGTVNICTIAELDRQLNAMDAH